MVQKIPKEFIVLSRNLRRKQTPWEAKLWHHLRGGRMLGLKFKRQFRLGSYIVDYYCASRYLVIELDGGQHSEHSVHIIDQKKEKYLKQAGLQVLRFWNNEVDENLDAVLEKIRLEVIKPHP